MNEDTSTLTIGPLNTLTGAGRGLPLLPALTIAFHPDTRRVGTIAPLTALLNADSAALTREEPVFFPPGSNVGRSIDHRAMSRDAVLSVVAAPGVLELRRAVEAKGEVEIDGEAFAGVRPITAANLHTGLVITVAKQFVFVLHGVRYPVSRSPNLGLLGVGDSIEEVRRLIAKTAELTTPVLLRGESGTGKEVVARAIHTTSARRSKPFVPVNMTTVLPNSAVSELFGHEKGSFTGATESRPGHFLEANGGTLFLDEIGDTHADVQPMLLRVLDDRCVQPFGSSRVRPVDVRVIAATDARLEAAVNAGRFHRALYHRLDSAFQIALPPLRHRREDIGLLFFAFLRRALAASKALHVLDEPGERARPWLPARVIAAICSAPWPGNVRSLEGMAEELAARVGVANFKPAEYVADRIAQQFAVIQPAAPAERAGAAPASPPALRGRSGEITNDQILDVFDRVGWNITRAAAVFGLHPGTLSRRLKTEPGIQLLVKHSRADLLRQKASCADDLQTLAEALGVPVGLLARRLGSSTD